MTKMKKKNICLYIRLRNALIVNKNLNKKQSKNMKLNALNNQKYVISVKLNGPMRNLTSMFINVGVELISVMLAKDM
jgi:hypothetical protein